MRCIRLSIYLELELPDHRIKHNSVFNFLRGLSYFIQKWLYRFTYIPGLSFNAQRFQCCHIFANTCYFSVFDNSRIAILMEWYLILVLICIFLMISWAFFSCAYWPSLCLWRHVCSSPLPIFELSCFCCISLYILDIDPLSDTLLATICSHSVGHLFSLARYKSFLFK